MDGAIILVNKPAGMSSFDVIRRFKKQTGFGGKIGHAGTLDKFADGLLILLLGKATKKFEDFLKMKKEYVATAKLYHYSPTLDIDGKVVKKGNVKRISKVEIEKAAKKLIGKISQRIPDYSAAKLKGQTRYRRALRGEKLEDKYKDVVIEKIKILKVTDKKVEFLAVVSSGTYIRQLSYDLFKSLGVESVLEKLVRTKIGKYEIEDALTIDKLNDWQRKAIFV